MNKIITYIKGFFISLLFKFIKKNNVYDVGRIRTLVKFTNGKRAEVSIIGKLKIYREAISKDKLYPLEYGITSAVDLLHKFLEDTESGVIDFIVGDDRVYYRLDQNTIDEVKIMESASHIVSKTVYDKVRK